MYRENLLTQYTIEKLIKKQRQNEDEIKKTKRRKHAIEENY